MPRPLAAVLLLGLAGCASVAPRTAVVATAAASDPSGLEVWDGALALGVGDQVRVVRGGAVVRVLEAGGRVHGLRAGAGDTLWVAADAGLLAVPGLEGEPVAVALPSPDRRVLALEVAGGEVWAATPRGGVYARRGGRWAEVSGAAAVTGIAAVGPARWLGTQQGVTRVEGAASSRFTEEGTTEHGLFDNVVDRLFATSDGVVWAAHPVGVSVFADGEPHGFPFVGRAGAAFHDAVALPGGGYVLASSEGLLMLPTLSARPEGFYEVYADSGADARALAGVTPAALAGPPVTRLVLEGPVLWLASRAGVWSVDVSGLAPAVAAR